MVPPKVAIIGAGPGGLTLARLLQINGIDCTVYEADERRGIQNQSGTLDLHPKAGQRALREAGLFDEFKKYARPESEADKIVRSDGHVYWDENQLTERLRPAEVNGTPEIGRIQLLNILFGSIEPSRIRWKKKLTRVETDPRLTGKTNIYFADGTKETGIDLIVGADGAWSRVRPLLTDTKPFYSGITVIELWALDVSQNSPWLSRFVGAGSCFMFDEGRAIIAQRMHDDSIRVYACVRAPETWMHNCKINWSDDDSARAALIQRHFNDCSADLKRLISHTRDALVVRPLYMLPVGATWKHTPGVTMIGDAAHLMTPFGGVGVNVAMTDALLLARALIGKYSSVVAKAAIDANHISCAVREYEAFMFKYARENAEKTAEGLRNHFSAGGGERRAQKYRDYYTQMTGKRLSVNHFDRGGKTCAA